MLFRAETCTVHCGVLIQWKQWGAIYSRIHSHVYMVRETRICQIIIVTLFQIHFIGLSFAVENLKSLILTLCCTEQCISIERAVLLSRLEEEFQVKWNQ